MRAGRPALQPVRRPEGQRPLLAVWRIIVIVVLPSLDCLSHVVRSEAPMFRNADLIWVSDQLKDLLSLEDELTTGLEASVSKIFGGKVGTSRKQGKKRYIADSAAKAARTGIYLAWTGNDFLTFNRKLFRDRLYCATDSKLNTGQLCVFFGRVRGQELQFATCVVDSLPSVKTCTPDRTLNTRILGSSFRIQFNTIEEIRGTSVLLDPSPAAPDADSIVLLCRISGLDPLKAVPLAILSDPQVTHWIKRRLACPEAVAAWKRATNTTKRSEATLLFSSPPAETGSQEVDHSSSQAPPKDKATQAQQAWNSTLSRLEMDLPRLTDEMDKTSLFSQEEIDVATVRCAQLAILTLISRWGDDGAPVPLYSEYRRAYDQAPKYSGMFGEWFAIVDGTSEKFNDLVFKTESDSFRATVPDRFWLDYFRDRHGALFAALLPFNVGEERRELWCKYVIPSTFLRSGAALANYRPYSVVEWGPA